MKFKIFVFLCLTCSFLITAQNKFESSLKFEVVENWGEHFNSVSLDGTFVLKKMNSDTVKVHNLDRSFNPYLPASTYKILNSLIALESNVIKDENEIIKWDGTKRFYEMWNKDQTLANAIKYSCVWAYQELARRVGTQKMQYFLDTVKYGNSKMGAEIDNFWLEGELRISAQEQIEFLTKFLKHDLPFSHNNIEIVKNIMIVESSDNYKLFAKTGWTARVAEDKQIGWYVGFVENSDGYWIFAMNIDIMENADSKNRQEITNKILKQEGIIL
jgi:beta-lactamase class D